MKNLGKSTYTDGLLVSIIFVLGMLLFCCFGCSGDRADGKILVEKEVVLGESLGGSSRAFYMNGGEVNALMSKDIDPATGNGAGLYFLQGSFQDLRWQLKPFDQLSGKRIGMYDLVICPDLHSSFVVYVDRTNEDDIEVRLDRIVENNSLQPVFRFKEGYSVLNPTVVCYKDIINVFVPFRGVKSRIRWFRVDPATGNFTRNDIQVPGSGARIYQGGLYRNQQDLFMAVGVGGAAHLLQINLDDGSHRIITFDTIEHDEAPRMFSLFSFDKQNSFVITYLRPADFSKRAKTGLIGEVVAVVLDKNSLALKAKVPLGKFSSSNAATHYTHSTMTVGENFFLTVYTTVRDVHSWHLERVHEKYNVTSLVKGSLSLGHDKVIDVELLAEMDPVWGGSLAYDDQHQRLILSSTDADNRNTAKIRLIKIKGNK